MEQMVKNSKQKNYTPPQISTCLIYMEDGITKGSAQTIPTHNDNTVLEEWKIGDDIETTINW